MRAVENIRSGTTVYTPLVEVIVNAIQAIEAHNTRGEIKIIVERSVQIETDGGVPAVESFEIIDNGIGFTEENRESFDTLYSEYKMTEGGKGFGRFTCLKYFKNLKVDSCYSDAGKFWQRTFAMGKHKDIIVNEDNVPSKLKESGSRVRLIGVKEGKFPDKKLKTIAKHLVEKLLPYFITKDYICPQIKITEKDNTNTIILNDYVENELSGFIENVGVVKKEFTLKQHKFHVRVFKFYSPKSHQKSKISLVAHKREATDIAIHNYIPEFIDEFYDEKTTGNKVSDRNFIIKIYVFGNYLDKNVSLERGGFYFKKAGGDLHYGISKDETEKIAAVIAQGAVSGDIKTRQEKKVERVNAYVENHAPWHQELLKNIDISSISMNPSRKEIETKLQTEKYIQEVAIKQDVEKILSDTNLEDIRANVPDIVRKISETSKNDLVHYIALRRNILEIFEKSLEVDKKGKYASEGLVHDIIFPKKKDNSVIPFEGHNLWMIDERLNFTNYVASDLPLNGGKSERPDLLIYNHPVGFRADNEPSNPITIFEFKKPKRDDFANPSSKDDPIKQIIRYVNSIKDGEFLTPTGKRINVADNTPFYGYVVCELNNKVEKWLKREKDFKPMADRLGWFRWREQINLYIEVLSWDKVLKDANMRNRIFFHKLGID